MAGLLFNQLKNSSPRVVNASQNLFKMENMVNQKDEEFLNKSLDIIQSDRERKIEMLEEIQIEVTRRLGIAAEFRDNETGKHVERIGDYANLMAGEIDMAAEEKTLLKYAAPMHDVGKIGVPDHILLKTSKLRLL